MPIVGVGAPLSPDGFSIGDLGDFGVATSFVQLRSVLHASSEGPSTHMSRASTFLLQVATNVCDPLNLTCTGERERMLMLLCFLTSSITVVICMFAFFREDKEEHITPLCPQLVVKDRAMQFGLPLNEREDNMELTDTAACGKLICKVVVDWPDPFRPGASGVAATVRLQSQHDITLATVVARNMEGGQGLALCRSGCEIFGFVEPDGDRRYHVYHRTRVHLLTLMGDFNACRIDVMNPSDAVVGEVKMVEGVCSGHIVQHVDAGLVICSLLAVHVHRRLVANVLPMSLVAEHPASTAAAESSTTEVAVVAAIAAALDGPLAPEAAFTVPDMKASSLQIHGRRLSPAPAPSTTMPEFDARPSEPAPSEAAPVASPARVRTTDMVTSASSQAV